MDNDDLRASCALLGVGAEATLREVESAYRQLCELYSDDSLATYSLFDYAERKEKLAAIEAAYAALVQARICPLPVEEPEPAAPVAGTELPVTSDPRTEPGLYLRQHRERLGLSLQDVAERTKIGIYHLRNIESQQCQKLPAVVYLRGFVREFARAVNAGDIDAVVEGFLLLAHRPEAP